MESRTGPAAKGEGDAGPRRLAGLFSRGLAGVGEEKMMGKGERPRGEHRRFFRRYRRWVSFLVSVLVAVHCSRARKSLAFAS